MFNKRVKVIGYPREKQDETNKTTTDFLPAKKSVVVEERNVAALFRRDDDFRNLSVRIVNTTDALTPGLFFSDFNLI